MIELARSCGLSAKFTGSGGAIVCIRNHSLSNIIAKDNTIISGNAFTSEEFIDIQHKFRINGFHFEKIDISTTCLF